MNPFDNILDDEEIQELRKNHNHLRIKFNVLSIFTIIFIFSGMVLFKREKFPTYLEDLLNQPPNRLLHNINQSNRSNYSNVENFQNSLVSNLNGGKGTIQLHSQNDYWRESPLFDALKSGIISIETDCWYLDGQDYELFIGHYKYQLTNYKTLNSLYLGNLNKILDDVNSYNYKNSIEGEEKKGVFNDDPTQTLYLTIDIKNNPELTFKTLQQNLEIFQLKNYLTYYNTTSNEWFKGPITIIISGENIPYDSIKNLTIRNTFIDSPLYEILDISNQSNHSEFELKYSNQLSIFASSSLEKLIDYRSSSLSNYDFVKYGLNDEQIQKLKQYISKAHELGLKVRIWDTSINYDSLYNSLKTNIGINNKGNNNNNIIWNQLKELEVDLLNVDNNVDLLNNDAMIAAIGVSNNNNNNNIKYHDIEDNYNDINSNNSLS
ncbi:hypothetical protein WICMUC_004384 [Wickerhamomyces mucosus]|uniref:Altered inheritance of mitochondria protein 6 n=1 Tax=Wickerhamomyces mucosus TaxID=1378264 RepID=A0A9P8TB42_9ASCO|nr:hypothetical protein WICMUC_004384 [Wickerhamomyces mucosus]